MSIFIFQSHKDSPRKGKDDSNYNYDRQVGEITLLKHFVLVITQ